jgi:hypothetical protein
MLANIYYCNSCKKEHHVGFHAWFTFYLHENFIILDDRKIEGSRSLTNDVEHALCSIKEKIGLNEMKGKFVIYRDTLGVWDQVLINDKCEFVEFRSLGGLTALPAALSRCEVLHSLQSPCTLF